MENSVVNYLNGMFQKLTLILFRKQLKNYYFCNMNPVVNNKDQIINLIVQNKDFISQFGAERIGLFGSFVRNEQTNESDIDLLVDFEKDKKTYKNFIRLAYYFEDIFGRKVELITTQSLSPYIKPYIMQEVEYVSLLP